jgi:hypothetical protein
MVKRITIKITVSKYLIQIIVPIRNPVNFRRNTTIIFNTFKKYNCNNYFFDHDNYKSNFDAFIKLIDSNEIIIKEAQIHANSNNPHNLNILYDFLNLKMFLNVSVIFGKNFDYPIVLDNDANSNIQTVIAKGKSVKNLSHLPKNLINLHLSKDHHPNAKLPQTINLYLHNSYNKQINLDNANITNVNFGTSYNKPIKFTNPHIKSLKFGYKFNSILDNIPFTVEIISINSYKYDFGFDYLPNSIKELEINISSEFNHYLDNLPNSIIKLKLNLPLKYHHSLSNLPISIQDLKIKK